MQLKEHQYPLYIMVHPVDGYQEMKWNKKASVPLAGAILLLWFFAEILSWQCTGFIFNPNKPNEMNIYLILVKTLVLFSLWVVANWALCTLMDGEGRFADIWVASAYALLPYIITLAVVAVLSNFLVMQESSFLEYAMVIGQSWSIVLMFFAMQVVHQYSVKKTLVSMALTVVGIGIILFLCILLFSLFQQLYIFAYTICSEIKFRL